MWRPSGSWPSWSYVVRPGTTTMMSGRCSGSAPEIVRVAGETRPCWVVEDGAEGHGHHLSRSSWLFPVRRRRSGTWENLYSLRNRSGVRNHPDGQSTGGTGSCGGQLARTPAMPADRHCEDALTAPCLFTFPYAQDASTPPPVCRVSNTSGRLHAGSARHDQHGSAPPR